MIVYVNKRSFSNQTSKRNGNQKKTKQHQRSFMLTNDHFKTKQVKKQKEEINIFKRK